MSHTTQQAKTTNPCNEALPAIAEVQSNSTTLELEKAAYNNHGGTSNSVYSPKSTTFIMTIVGCAFGLAGSQIYSLLYLPLGTIIARDLGCPELYSWMLTCGILAMGALAPFIGPLADILGRKAILQIGFFSSIVGSIICAVTPNGAGFIAGQTLLGFGSVTQELVTIAIIAEIVPATSRSFYLALVLCAIIPWSPGTLYANLMANSSWRWIGLALGLWNAISLLIIWIWYQPPPRPNTGSLQRKEKLKKIDLMGGLLITSSLCLILIPLNGGGQQYAWQSSLIITTFVVGGCFFVLFVLWEWLWAPHPLYPRRIIHAPRPFLCTMIVIVTAGINYVPLVVLWPIQTISVFQSDQTHVGIYTIPIGTCILAGSIISALFLGVVPRCMHLVMFLFCCVQTVGAACMVLVNPKDISTAWAPLTFALLGIGGVLIPNQVILTIITPDDRLASVTALAVGVRAQAQTIGLAIFVNQFYYQVSKNTLRYVVPAFEEISFIDESTPIFIDSMMSQLSAIPFDRFASQVSEFQNSTVASIVQAAVVRAYSTSFEYMWYVSIAFGATACIAAALIGSVHKYLDGRVAASLH